MVEAKRAKKQCRAYFTCTTRAMTGNWTSVWMDSG